MSDDVTNRVRLALGRTSPLARVPAPPPIPEPLVRLVHTDFGLSELFIHAAAENRIDIQPVRIEELPAQLIEFLRSHECRRLAMNDSEFINRLELAPSLREAGFDLRPSNSLLPDELRDTDAAITDVHAAVAETGSLVMRPGQDGVSFALVAPIHIAIVEPRNLVGDLLDLFERLGKAGQHSQTVLISGPPDAVAAGATGATAACRRHIMRVFILQ